MDKEQLKQLLKDNLSLTLTFSPAWYEEGNVLKATIKFDGEEITSDSVTLDK